MAGSETKWPPSIDEYKQNVTLTLVEDYSCEIFVRIMRK
jgi:hypothetical protein